MISFENVSFSYEGEDGKGGSVRNINLRINVGEFVVFCGESGCGKTTLTRLINGLIPNFYEGHLDGRVLVGGKDVSNGKLSDTSALVGSVFQNPRSQFFNMDTTGELVFGCENQNLSREEIGRRLSRTRNDMQLDILMDRDIFELSGGEKQQIACGSVYTSDPRVFVMDEPSSNLDRKAIERLKNILKIIKTRGRTVILAEHRLYYIMELADRFVYMKNGEIDRIYTREEMYALKDSDLADLGLRCTNLSTLKRNENIPMGFEHENSIFAIEAFDMVCSRGNARILDVDRLNIPKGAVVALIGDNGSGKSTFAESITGLIPAGGSISVNNSYLADKERSKISFMVMQDVNRQLFSDSVMEEVMMNSDAKDEEAEEILKELGLYQYKDRHPASLSGGEKQRTAIASALLARKSIMVFDEPTSGLDRKGMENFGKLLLRLKGQFLSSIIITHDPELIMQCATHVLHIERGKISEFYPVDSDGKDKVLSYFISIDNENTGQRRSAVSAVGKILNYAGEDKKKIYLSCFIIALGSLSGIGAYFIAFDIVNKILKELTAFNVPISQPVSIIIPGIFISVAVFLLCQILYTMLYAAGLLISDKAAHQIVKNIRYFLQEKSDKQALDNIFPFVSKAMKKSFVDEMESMVFLLLRLIPEITGNLSVIIISLLLLIAVDWSLTFCCVIMIIIGISISRQMYRTGINQTGNYSAASKRLSNIAIEYVKSIAGGNDFNGDDKFKASFLKAVNFYRDSALIWHKVSLPWKAMYESVFYMTILYSLPLGALLVGLGQLSIAKYILSICLSFEIGPLVLKSMDLVSLVPQISLKIQALEKALEYPAS